MDNNKQQENPIKQTTTKLVPEYQPPIPIDSPVVQKDSNTVIIAVLIIVVVFMILFIGGVYFYNSYYANNQKIDTTSNVVTDTNFDEYNAVSSDNTTTSSNNTTDSTANNNVPTTEDKQAAEKAIRDYFALLNEKKFTEAVDSMSHNTINSETIKQEWISSFSNLSSVEIKTLEEVNAEMWINSTPQYHILFNVTFDPTKVNNSKFDEGENSRYIFVINEDGIKKLHSFQTTTDTIF